MAEKAKRITDVKQMHKRPSRRCYIMSVDGIPRYRLAFERHKDGRLYGWIGIHVASRATSIVNPFFPMSDTARGAIRNELGRTTYVSCGYNSREVPLVFHEFINLEQAKEYFAPLIKDKYISHKYPFVWAQEKETKI